MQLPLFPLGLVLLPGLVLPLHVFEERYRALVQDLLALPERDRQFGVVCIREGREVGADGVRALFEVGVVARLEQVEPHEDGRYDIVTVGAERFRLGALVEGKPYLQGEVELIPDDDGDEAEAVVLARAVQAGFRDYVDALGEARGDELTVGELPDEPEVLSYLVAAGVEADLADRQALLEHLDTEQRLAAELRLLRRESTLLRALSAVPAPHLARVPPSPN